jgi:phage N-6-adenine-methyltransferase
VTALTISCTATLVDIELAMEREIGRIAGAAFALGALLDHIRMHELYREAGYDTFDAYCRTRRSMAPSRARQLIAAARTLELIEAAAPEDVTIVTPANEAQARPLAALPPTERAEAWQQAVAEAGGQPTAKVVASVVDRHIERVNRLAVNDELAAKPDVVALVKSSRSNEWYTPREYIEAAREVMGGIDLDPASCEAANRVVQADKYHTVEDNGLKWPWFGRVWLNPPYGKTAGRSNAGIWLDRLLSEHETGRVSAACILVGANTDTQWFQPLWDMPLCFVAGRIAFEGGEGDSNTNGSAIAYLGPDAERFRDVFARLGAIVRRWEA